MNKPIRVWWNRSTGVWHATCWKCGLMSNGMTAAAAYDNLIRLAKRVHYDLNPTSSPAIQAGLDRLPRC